MLGRIERHLPQFVAPGQERDGWVAIAPAFVGKELDLPPEFSWRDYTIFLLTIAAQIEHSLMVQYLYAAYSLGGPQIPANRRVEVAAWRQVVLGIAKEEMGHLITVQNALRFLGAPLALDREDYPWDIQLAPYPFTLERLTRVSLAKYILAESPQEWPNDVSVVERNMIETLASSGGPHGVNRVGVIFERLHEIISSPAKLPDVSFRPESYPLQASWDEWARGYGKGARGSSIAGTKTTPDVLVLQMASRSQALDALQAVADQGEAPGSDSLADSERSHFRRFLAIFRAFPASGEFDPALMMPTNPVAPGIAADPQQTPIVNPEGALWANIFNLRYRMLLSYLAHTYHTHDRTGVEKRRGVVINRMFAEMYNLRSIASILSHLSLGNGSSSRCGPTFQMPYTLQLPDTESAYWVLHLDLISATADLLAHARVVGRGTDRADYAVALARLDSTAAAEIALYADADRVRTGAKLMLGSVA